VHGGLPSSLEALRALPGFGPYTAGAVASIAFAIPAAAVDGNVARVLARLFLVRGDPAGRHRAQVDTLAGALVHPERPGDLNQALMDLGATVCGKPVPGCERCPVTSLCAARRAGLEREVPPARKRPVPRPLVLGCAVVRQGDAILVARRPARGLFAGLWSLPSAELRPDDDPRRALARALRGEHGLRAAVREEVAACERTLTHRALMLRAFRCELRGPLRETRRLRFASPRVLRGLAIPAATRALLEHIATDLW
jgi:A/G-specific adenine glycosylase